AAARAGVDRFVHMSSTSIYGEDEQLPLPVREDVVPRPSRGYGKAKWGAEEAAWKASTEGLPVVVLRPVTVYGPGNVKLLASAILDVAIEHFALLGDGGRGARREDGGRGAGRGEGGRGAGASELPVHREPVEQRLLHIDDLVAATIH